MTNHTPGPWIARGWNVYRDVDEYGPDTGPDWGIVAQVGSDFGPRTLEYHDRVMADARLIAASPDLLALVRLMHSALAQVADGTLDSVSHLDADRLLTESAALVARISGEVS